MQQDIDFGKMKTELKYAEGYIEGKLEAFAQTTAPGGCATTPRLGPQGTPMAPSSMHNQQRPPLPNMSQDSPAPMGAPSPWSQPY